MRRGAASLGHEAAIVLLNSSVHGGLEATSVSFSVNSMRCPEGCAFGVVPNATSLIGWNDTTSSTTSTTVHHVDGTTTTTATLPAEMSAPLGTPPLPILSGGMSRIELKLGRDFGDEDLLLVQEELKQNLATVLNVPADTFTIVQVYGGGQYFLMDLPEGPLVTKLQSKAHDLGSSLFETRILGELDGIIRLDGLGGHGNEETLGSDLQKGLSGLGKASIGELVMLVVFLAGVLLATGLIIGICYGTMRQGAGEKIPEIKKKDAKRTREAKHGTAEEKISVLHGEDDDEEAEEAVVAPVNGHSKGGDEVHVDISVQALPAGGATPPVLAEDDGGVDIDELMLANQAKGRQLLAGMD